MIPKNPQLVQWARNMATQHLEQRVNEVTTTVISHMEAFAQATLGLEFYADKAAWEIDENAAQSQAVLELEKTQAQQAVLAIVKSLIMQP